MTAHTPAHAHVALMDRMYRHTRHVYDLSRRYYLLGRDEMLRDMALAPDDRVLEVGCGTARNLIRLARLAPTQRLFGLDASHAMLDTAQRHLARHGLTHRVQLRQGLAEDLHPRHVFGLDEPFNVIFFSYSLSMMPTWREAMDAAMRSLAPGGRIHIVDFWDQAGLPAWFARMLRAWLAMFHVRHRPELLSHLQQLEHAGAAHLHIRPIARRYALLATLRLRSRPALA